MIDVKRLRQDPEGSRALLARRLDPATDALLDRIVALDRNRRELLVRAESLKAERNAANEEVARLKKAKEDATELLARLKVSGEEVKALDAELRAVDEALDAELLSVPNFLHESVPDGPAEKNVVVRSWGTVPSFDFAPKPHWELGESLGILDLPAGAKVAGSGFPLMKGQGAKLVRALANFMLDLHTTEHGYTEVAPPYLVNAASARGTGQLPKFADELYTITSDGLYLIPTSEVPVTNIHRDEILEGSVLPIAYCAWTPCFRREAGAAGKDTRGLIRVHQFDKVELVRFVRPETSDAEHELIGLRGELEIAREHHEDLGALRAAEREEDRRDERRSHWIVTTPGSSVPGRGSGGGQVSTTASVIAPATTRPAPTPMPTHRPVRFFAPTSRMRRSPGDSVSERRSVLPAPSATSVTPFLRRLAASLPLISFWVALGKAQSAGCVQSGLWSSRASTGT